MKRIAVDSTPESICPAKKQKALLTGPLAEPASNTADNDEVDYMTMPITDEPCTRSENESLTSLARNTDNTSSDQHGAAKLMPKGFAMMNKMGFKLGESLGKDRKSAIKEPIAAASSRKKQGIRMATPVRELASTSQEEAAQFRKHVQDSSDRSKKLRTLRKMQKLAFELSGDVDRLTAASDARDFNCLWRQYVLELQNKLKPNTEVEPKSLETQESRLKETLHTSRDFQTHLVVTDSKTVDECKGAQTEVSALNDSMNPIEDEELDLFEQLTQDQQISGLNTHLRVELFYCFYCGEQYTDEKDLFEHCPGPLEEDHN